MLAVKLSPMINITEITDLDSFLNLANEWNDLVERANNQTFYRHEFIRIWLKNFSPQAKLRILIGRDPSTRLVAVLPLIEERVLYYGLPVRQLISPSNIFSNRFDLIAEDAVAAGHSFFQYLSTDKSWDLIVVKDIPDGGNSWELFCSAKSAHYPVGIFESHRSPYIVLPNNYDQLKERLTSKFNANMRRKRKRLEEQGEVTLEKITGGPNVFQKLAECLAIEQSGWKGRDGQAANQDENKRKFYNDLAQIGLENNLLVLLLLKLNGKPIAFHFGFIYGNTFLLFMTSFDETYYNCSPGQLLMIESLKDCMAQGLKKFDFLGCDLGWKLDWTEQVCTHKWLYIYRNNNLGRILQKAKFSLIPSLKQFSLIKTVMKQLAISL